MSLGQYGLRKRKKIARGYLLTFVEYSNISAYFFTNSAATTNS